MASIVKKETKDGRAFYEIRCRRGREKSTLSTRWYVPDGWSARAIQRELARQAADFERRVEAGEITSRKEKRQEAALRAAQEAEEAARIKTLRQYATEVFMPAKESYFSENARASYQLFLDKHIFPAFGEIPLHEITTAKLQAFFYDFSRQGYAPATITKLYNIVSGIFAMAFEDDSIAFNPMLKVKKPASRKDDIAEEKALAYTAEETAVIVKALQNEPLKWRAYVTLMIDTGARRGEICALQWSDIDFEHGEIFIRRNLQYTPASGVYLATPKNGKARFVDIGAASVHLLTLMRKVQPDSTFVFTQDGDPTKPMHPQSPTRYFRKFGSKYGIEDFHPHKLRHTSASIAITNGADVVSTSARLGHSDTAITLRLYAHASKESVRRAGEVARSAISDLIPAETTPPETHTETHTTI